MTVAIVVPVLRRPHRVQPLLDSIAASTPGDYWVLFVASPDDTGELQALKSAGGAAWITTNWPGGTPGDYARKINLGYQETTEPLIFTGADDLKFHPGWFEAATAQLRPNIGMVGTNDLGNPRVKAGRHSTHSLIRREYADLGTIDESRKIYCERYWHEFADDEAVRTAQARRAFAWARSSRVEHLHPHWGKAPTDPIYDQSPERLVQGRQLFNQRRQLWSRRLPPFQASQ